MATDERRAPRPADSAAALDPRPRVQSGPRLGRVHDRILNVLAEVDAGAPADRALANAFRRARDLGGSERAEIREEVYGLLRRRRRAEDVLVRGMSALKKDGSLLDPPMRLRLELLAHLALEGATLEELEARDRYGAGRIPGLFARITSGRLPARRASAIEAAAIDLSLPTWLYRHLSEGIGEERAHEVALALSERAPLTLRVDETRMSRQDALDRLEALGVPAVATSLAPAGVVVTKRADIRELPEARDGRLEVQDEGSQLVALAVGARPGERVLDACAGAGGKTLALWTAMRGQGELVAIEPDKKKREELQRRLKGAGARVRIEGTELEALPESLRGHFDRVLVDAPCTGTGTLRRHPDLKWRLDPADPKREAGRQIRLLGAALAALRPGGRLVYATCSVLAEENEWVVEAFAKTAPELELAAVEEGWDPALAAMIGRGPMVRIGPGPTALGPDGFFVAALRRKTANGTR